LKDNNVKNIKEEFVVKELESQHIFFIIFKSSILISYTTIFKALYLIYCYY